jgi:hypothetical protein
VPERQAPDDDTRDDTNKKSVWDEARWDVDTPRVSFELLHIICKRHGVVEPEGKLPWGHFTSELLNSPLERRFVLSPKHTQFQLFRTHSVALNGD